MDIQELIMSGDSAGAHLCSSVNLLAAGRRFRTADALVLLYPIFNLDIDYFYPSAVLSIDEEMIN